MNGTIDADGVTIGIEARDLEHMAEILADTLPDADAQRLFVADIDDGRIRVAFTCTGTFFEVL